MNIGGTFFSGLVLLGMGLLIYRNRRSFTNMNPFLGEDETSPSWRFAYGMNTVGSMVFVAVGILFVVVSVVSAITVLLER